LNQNSRVPRSFVNIYMIDRQNVDIEITDCINVNFERCPHLN
jgi:hypothetical protein